MKGRLEFAKKHRNWTTINWERASIWSHKTKIEKIVRMACLDAGFVKLKGLHHDT